MKGDASVGEDRDLHEWTCALQTGQVMAVWPCKRDPVRVGELVRLQRAWRSGAMTGDEVRDALVALGER